MNRTFNRLRLGFLALFAIACVAVFAYQFLWAWPKKACEDKGAAWAPRWRACARIVHLPDITRRAPTRPAP